MKAEINCDQKRRETMIANSRCIACNLSKKEQKIQNIRMKKRKKHLFRKLPESYINTGIKNQHQC